MFSALYENGQSKDAAEMGVTELSTTVKERDIEYQVGLYVCKLS